MLLYIYINIIEYIYKKDEYKLGVWEKFHCNAVTL